MKVLVGAFNQEKAVVVAFSVIVKTNGSFAALDRTSAHHLNGCEELDPDQGVGLGPPLARGPALVVRLLDEVLPHLSGEAEVRLHEADM